MNSSTNKTNFYTLDYLFHPRSIAVIGVSPDLKRTNVGRLFLDGLVDHGYRGRLYAVGLAEGNALVNRDKPIDEQDSPGEPEDRWEKHPLKRVHKKKRRKRRKEQ